MVTGSAWPLLAYAICMYIYSMYHIYICIYTCIHTYMLYVCTYICMYVYECMYICVYHTHIYGDKSCMVCLVQSGTSWLTCMLGCSPCTLDTCPGWLSSCRLFFCTVLCITRQLLTSDAHILLEPQFQQVLSGPCKAEKLTCKADSRHWTKTGQQCCGNMTTGGDYQGQDDCHKTAR